MAECRALAEQALRGEEGSADDLTDEGLGVPDDPWGEKADRLTAYDTETGEVIEPDRIAQQVAERRGAAPADTAAPEFPPV